MQTFTPTPRGWRLALGGGLLLLLLAAFFFQGHFTGQGQAALGILFILGLVALFSANLRAVNPRTLLFGLALQFFLAWFILRFEIYGLEWLDIPDGYAPGRELFASLAEVITLFMNFTLHGAEFVFGPLGNPGRFGQVTDPALGPGSGFIMAFAALTTIIFVSSFFTVLYFFGILQWVVRVFARGMVHLLGTSGAETLSASANVFMGQTEAPLIVKPYVPRMTQSELLALMVGGMATISGGLMAVYVSFGAEPISLLTTSVMAAPCSLYLSKLMLPEMEEPETRGTVTTSPEQPHRNAIDAAAGGAADGLVLALNVAAMLIAFLAFLALINALLASLPTGQPLFVWVQDAPEETGRVWIILGRSLLVLASFALAFYLGRKAVRAALSPDTLIRIDNRLGQMPRFARWLLLLPALILYLLLLDQVLAALPENLSLRTIFSGLFWPLAFFLGVEGNDISGVADLLGTKLVSNEFVAYVEMGTTYREQFSPRTIMLATFALTGFANFGSVGIQLGGIGSLAPTRRADLARLGVRALFVGYLATLLNAAIAGLLLPD